MAAMQSHLPYVTDYANAARRFGTVDIMVRPVVADIPILAFGRYAEIGARVTRRAFARFERGNSQTRTSYRRWTTARARGDPPRAEAAEDAREEAPRSRARRDPAGARGAGADAEAEADGDVAKRERARASGTQGGFFLRGWGFDGGGGVDEDAWEGSYDRPAPARAGVGTIGTRIPDDGGGGGGSGAAFEGERRAEAWVRGGGRYDRGFASPDQPAPSMTRRRAYGSHSQDRLDEFHRS